MKHELNFNKRQLWLILKKIEISNLFQLVRNKWSKESKNRKIEKSKNICLKKLWQKKETYRIVIFLSTSEWEKKNKRQKVNDNQKTIYQKKTILYVLDLSWTKINTSSNFFNFNLFHQFACEYNFSRNGAPFLFKYFI